jgi:hypothetical protein
MTCHELSPQGWPCQARGLRKNSTLPGGFSPMVKSIDLFGLKPGRIVGGGSCPLSKDSGKSIKQYDCDDDEDFDMDQETTTATTLSISKRSKIIPHPGLAATQPERLLHPSPFPKRGMGRGNSDSSERDRHRNRLNVILQ